MLYRYLIRCKCMFSNRTNTIQLVITKYPYQVLLWKGHTRYVHINNKQNFCFVGYCYPVFSEFGHSVQNYLGLLYSYSVGIMYLGHIQTNNWIQNKLYRV